MGISGASAGLLAGTGPDCTWARIGALASAPDGWGMLGRPEWGKFKFGYAYVGEANSGTLTAVSMCAIGAGKTSGLTVADVDVRTGCGQFIAALERAKVHSGQRSDWLRERMVRGGPEYLDAIVAYELDVISANRTSGRDLRELIVSIYPQDGIVLLGQPFTILAGAPWVTPDQVAAAKILEAFLLSDERQRALLATGHRPGNPSVGLDYPIDPSLGAIPQARLAALEIPDSRVVDRIDEVWHRVKKHAVVAIVFDKSAGMAGQKIGAAIKGAVTFVDAMDRDDVLIWRPFDDTTYPPMERDGSQKADLKARIAATPAGGGNAVYDAVLAAYDQLEAMRQARGDVLRYGIVVLSGARDTHSRATLAEMELRLRIEEADPTGVQIHTIALGADADETALFKIANVAHGRFWTGQPADMVSIYKAIATFY